MNNTPLTINKDLPLRLYVYAARDGTMPIITIKQDIHLIVGYTSEDATEIVKKKYNPTSFINFELLGSCLIQNLLKYVTPASTSTPTPIPTPSMEVDKTETKPEPITTKTKAEYYQELLNEMIKIAPILIKGKKAVSLFIKQIELFRTLQATKKETK